MKNISTKKSVVLIAAVIVLILAGIIISVSTDKNRKMLRYCLRIRLYRLGQA